MPPQTDLVSLSLVYKAHPPRGTPLEVMVQWVPDPLIDTTKMEAHLSTFIRDRTTGTILPPLPFIYTGSYFHIGQVPTAKGLEDRPMFMLDSNRSMIVTGWSARPRGSGET